MVCLAWKCDSHRLLDWLLPLKHFDKHTEWCHPSNALLRVLGKVVFSRPWIYYRFEAKNKMILHLKWKLKSPNHGFLKMTVHMVWNIALREWKHPAKVYIWKCTVYKVIVFQKWESTLSLWIELFLKRVISWFVVM